jgi:signal transduction histidine kinase
VEGFHLRVLSVPVFVGERTIGTVQIGSSLELVDRTLNTLFQALLILFVLATVLFWVLGWISSQRLLLPLEKAKDAALLITQTSDLTRRIPASGIPGDEVDQLIDSFNQNISRLERLIETQRRFVADVGHELRTPLTVIKGNVGLMRRMKTYDEESLLGISEEVDRLARLVGDLILLAQAEAGKLPLERQDVELDTVLLDVFKQMSILARQKKIRLQLGDVDQILVCGDRDRLTQVLVNLISNAIKYTPAGSRVETGMIIQAGMVGLTVADNGPGIPAEHLPHIFERFYRAEQARQRSPDGRGYGLGLSIAYWIVANHNGRIEVDSRVGEGTNFTVWLPLKRGDCAEAAPGQGLMPST